MNGGIFSPFIRDICLLGLANRQKYCLNMVTPMRLATYFLSLLLAACGGGGTAAPASIAPASVSGLVLAATNSAIDTDINSFDAPFAENDSFASALLITNLITLGGYLNQANQGSTGRSFASGDTQDFFEVDLQAGQSVTLTIAQQVVTDDIDLILFDESQTIIDQSMTNATVECVENSVAGKYFVRANIAQGAANYTLSVTSLPCSVIAPSSNLRLANDFVSSELIIRPSESANISAMQAKLSVLGMSMGLMPHKQYARVYIADMTATVEAMGLSAVAEYGMPASLQDKAMTLAIIKAMQNVEGIALAEPNFVYQPFATPNDPFFPLQLHYPLIGLPAAWDQVASAGGGSGAVVAVLDTGVLVNHPDLQANLLPGFDFISSSASAADGDGIDADPSDPGDNPAGASSFHGSHVLGTVAAVSNNGVGVSGGAFFSNIRALPVRVLGVGGGFLLDICEGLRFSAGLTNTSGTLPTATVDVVNMSLGGGAFSQFLQDCTDDVRAAGVIVIAAAGNAANNEPMFPAANAGVVSVSAVDLTRSLSNFSSFGATIDVAAPGGEASDDDGDGVIDGVFSTVGSDETTPITNTFGFLIGTSMATPHVSATAALMRSVSPGLTPAQFDAMLAAGLLTDDLGAAGRDDSFGEGLINANRAVSAARGATLATPLLSAAPNGINFGLVATDLGLEVINVGGGDLIVNSPTENSGGWLTISSPGGNGLGVYTLTVDRGNPLLADPGSFSATVSFTSNGGNADLPVQLQVVQTGQSTTADAGRQNIVLLSLTDSNNNRVIALDVVEGGYPFTFDEVVPDTYLLVTTTDNDNDNIICDAGEACGALGTIDEPVIFNVLENQQIDVGSFVAGFSFATTASAVSASSTQTMSPLIKGLIPREPLINSGLMPDG